MRIGSCVATSAAIFLLACPPGERLPALFGAISMAEQQPSAGKIDQGTLRRHVEYLASEELAGRGPGTFQADSTIAYVMRAFLAADLEPGVRGQSYLLSDPVLVNVHAQGAVGLRDQDRGYSFGRDWLAHGVSGDGRDSSSVVFVGYGVTAPEYGYDDYRSVLTRGKAVLALMGEPGAGLPDGSFLSKATPPYHADPFQKALNAEAHGAGSLLLVRGDPTGLDEDRIPRPPRWTGFGVAGIPVFVVTREVAQNLLDTEGLDLGDLQFMIDKSMEPRSTELPEAWIEGILSMDGVPLQMITIAGRRPGTGHGAVVVAASYDGLGQGVDSRYLTLHPGAGDNASGVAALLEIVRAHVDAPPCERSVYFVAYAGRHFSAAGLASFLRSAGLEPREIRGVVDIGALGVGESLHIHGLSSAPTLIPAVDSVEMEISGLPRAARHEAGPMVGALNHFSDLEIPGILVCGDSDGRFGTPEDTPDRLDYNSMAQAAEYLLRLIDALASDSSVK